MKSSNFTKVDSKTKLQEFSLKKYKSLPIYKIISNTGPRHKPNFKVGVKIKNSKFTYSNSKSSYSDLLKDIEEGKIESIFFYPRQREIDVLYKNGDKFKIPILYNDQLILEKVTENKVELTVNNSRREASAANSFASISLFLIFILAIILILRSTSKLASRAFGLSLIHI